MLVGAAGHTTGAFALLLGGAGRGLNTELLPVSTIQSLGKVSIAAGGGATGAGLLIGADVGSTGDVFAGATLGAGQGTTNAGLNAGHAVGVANGSPLTDGTDGSGVAEITSLLEPGVGGAGDDFAATGFITGDLFGATGAAAADDLVAVGDAEAHLGGFGRRASATEAVELLTTDVFIASHVAAAAGLIAGDPLAAAHGGPGHAGATQGVLAADLGRGTARNTGVGAEVLIAGQMAA